MTLAEQLEQAKRRQEVADLDAGDQRTAAEFAKRISLPPLELPADIRALLDPFNKWASQRHARRCPAKPASVALFALEQADMGVAVDTILEQLSAIEQQHGRFGLPNPVKTVAVAYALQTLVKATAPRSWPKEAKATFCLLPPDIQRVLAKRQMDFDKELSRLHEEVARLRESAGRESLRQGIEPNNKSVSEHKDTTDESN